MASRRDQLQSYQFLVQRVVSALVMRETDPAQSPFRRLTGSAFASIMVAVLALAAVGVYGVIRPGGKDTWRAGNAVIVEKETGTRYVFRDGKLHPMANYASALLLLGSHGKPLSVSSNSLVGVARGPRLGIKDAPDALPGANRLLGAPWTLCSQQEEDASGERVPTSVLVVGEQPSGGRRLDDRAVLAEDTKTRKTYLIWHNHRYEIEGDKVLEALVLNQERRIAVGGAWLNALPAGEPLKPMAISGRGNPSQAVDNAVVGQVFVVTTQGGERQFYVALETELAPITEVQADILLAGDTNGAREMAPGVAAAAPKASAPPVGDEQPPAQRPDMESLPDSRTAVCAAFNDAGSAPSVLVNAEVPRAEDALRTATQTGDGTALADRVMVEPGWGAIVEAMPSPDARSGTLYLVTDQGERYPVATSQVLAILGYGDERPVRLPASLVVRIPEGPALSPQGAARPVATD
jgi:type VII secretion protein EccB